MVKKPARKPRAVSVYSNLAEKRRTKKDRSARKRAEYLASLPKHPVKRTLYRLHPKRVAQYWFSKRGLFTALKILGVGILLVVLAVGAVFAYYRKDLEAIRPDKINERVQTTVSKYYDRNGVLLWEDKGGGDYRLAVKSEDISEYMKQATVAIEDKDFYKHGGVSVRGLMRATLSNAQSNDVQGGSTLTQQLVKQVFLAEDAHKRGIDGIPRKIKEVILAIEVERTYNKDQILNLYLNESSYGGPRNGVESAAQVYFKKSAKDLTLPESALLAAIPNRPSLYNPYNTDGHTAVIARQHKVLDDMVEMGYITQSEADAAKKVAVLDAVQPEENQYANVKAPHFVRMVRDQLEKDLGKAIVGRGGLTITTTLDMRIQDKSQEAMDKLFASNWPAVGGFSNGAVTVMDVQTGQIIALLGSRDFQYPGFGQDNAAIAYLQPGSSIKPLVYASLFENKGAGNQNFGSGSILADDRSMDKIYGAELFNWDRKWRGAINIRSALALSRNVPAVKAMYITGVQPTLEKIHEAGDTSYCTVGQETQVGLAASIGGCGARMVEHTNAIATLARMGTYKPYSTVLEVKNSSGDVLKKYTEATPKQVFDPQSAYIVSDILSDDNARAGLTGRNRYGMVVPGVRTAIKTGTSDFGGNGKDLWNVSYSPAIAMSVWLGNSDNTILKQSNSTIPNQIVGDVMSYAHTEVYAKEGKWKSGDWFSPPAGLQTIRGELYPSWYNQARSQGSEKMTFDKVSKKKATNCTPADAKIDIDVMSYTDPITNRKIFSAPGYDPNAEDDVHKCDDAKPSVSVNTSGNGRTITVRYTAGSNPLSSVSVQVNGTEITSFNVSTSGSQTVPNTVGISDRQYTVSAKVIDSAFYSGTASATWQR